MTGPHLYTIAPHGSTDKLPYVTMGSGSLAAMAVFESKWKKDMTREEAIEIVKDAIESGIFNDLGSGSNVDVVVLTEAGAEVLRNYKRPNERGVKEKSYKFKKGTTGASSAFSNLVFAPCAFSHLVFAVGACRVQPCSRPACGSWSRSAPPQSRSLQWTRPRENRWGTIANRKTQGAIIAALLKIDPSSFSSSCFGSDDFCCATLSETTGLDDAVLLLEVQGRPGLLNAILLQLQKDSTGV